MEDRKKCYSFIIKEEKSRKLPFILDPSSYIFANVCAGRNVRNNIKLPKTLANSKIDAASFHCFINVNHHMTTVMRTVKRQCNKAKNLRETHTHTIYIAFEHCTIWFLFRLCGIWCTIFPCCSISHLRFFRYMPARGKKLTKLLSSSFNLMKQSQNVYSSLMKMFSIFNSIQMHSSFIRHSYKFQIIVKKRYNRPTFHVHTYLTYCSVLWLKEFFFINSV